jgi:hypothetical protein
VVQVRREMFLNGSVSKEDFTMVRECCDLCFAGDLACRKEALDVCEQLNENLMLFVEGKRTADQCSLLLRIAMERCDVSELDVEKQKDLALL